MVLSVIIHDGDTFLEVGFQPLLVHIDDARIEIARFSGDTLVDGIGNLVCNPPPDRLVATVDETHELVFGNGVEKPEAHPRAAVVLPRHPACDQGSGATVAPTLKLGLLFLADPLGILNERPGRDRSEDAGKLEIRLHDRGNIDTECRHVVIAVEIRHRDRDRVFTSLGHANVKLRSRPARQQSHEDDQTDVNKVNREIIVMVVMSSKHVPARNQGQPPAHGRRAGNGISLDHRCLL